MLLPDRLSDGVGAYAGLRDLSGAPLEECGRVLEEAVRILLRAFEDWVEFQADTYSRYHDCQPEFGRYDNLRTAGRGHRG